VQWEEMAVYVNKWMLPLVSSGCWLVSDFALNNSLEIVLFDWAQCSYKFIRWWIWWNLGRCVTVNFNYALSQWAFFFGIPKHWLCSASIVCVILSAFLSVSNSILKLGIPLHKNASSREFGRKVR
jgi:hypothetical protein